jgi:hypothetical protein
MVNAKPWFVIFSLLIVSLLLTSCGKPQRATVSPQETVPVVQQAVDRYVLNYVTPPVKKRNGEAGLYEQYPIDFKLLRQTLQLSDVPANAYENGGPFYYVLLFQGGEWHVKLIEMSVWQTVTDIQSKAAAYYSQTGSLPVREPVASGVYKLDAAALGLDTDQVRSVYSPQQLPLLISEDGTVVIDYAFEIMRIMQSLGDGYEPPADLRDVLTMNSFMVPIHSLPYVWENETPVIKLP